jgi:WD40 repeat protein
MSAPTERLDLGDARPPVRIPDHTLLRVIGRGSYGEVWEARNVMGTPRAVKIVRRDDFESARPFEREFEGIQRYEPVSRTHAGLVQVLHVGEDRDAGYFYYVMELAENADPGSVLYRPRTLRGDLQARGGLPVEECIEIGITLASALGHLHRAGLVHRDVKPANIIFVDGMAKLADVGLVARLSDSRSLVGTEGYFAPEGTGKPRSDVYSLGKVLYECITGLERTTFPDVPADWGGGPESRPAFEFMEIVLRAAEPNPDRRYADTDEMLADLALLKAGKSLRYLRRVETRLKRTLQVLAVAAVAVAAAGGAWLYEKHRADQIAEANQKATRAQSETQRLLGESLVAGARAERLSRLAGARAKALDAVRRGLDAGAPAVDLRTQAASALALYDAGEFTPDRSLRAPGHWVAWCPNASCVVMTDAGSGQSRVIDRSSGRQLATFNAGPAVMEISVSPQAEHVAVVHYDGRVALWETRSGRRRWELPPTSAPCRPSFSRDGTWLVCATNAGLTARACTDDSEPVLLAADSPPLRGVYLAPNGKWIATLMVPDGGTDGRANRNLGLRLYTGLTGNVPKAADAARLKSHVIDSDIRLEGVSISHDSQYVAAAVSEDRLRVWEVAGMSQIVWLRGHQRSVRSTAFHPLDSNIVASTSWDGTTRLWDMTTRREILVIPAGGEEVLISPERGEILLRGWDRYGVQAADFTQRSALRVFRIPPFTPLGLFANVGFNQDGRLLTAVGDAGAIVWEVASGEFFVAEPPGKPMDWRFGLFSPNGDALYFSGPKGLFRRSMHTEEPGRIRFGPKETVLEGFASFLQWSGDSLIISGRHDETGRPGVGVLTADGSQKLLLPSQPPDQIAASPDGRWLVAARYPAGGGTLWDLRTQPPAARDLETPTRAHFGFSADSRALITGTEKVVTFTNPANPDETLAAPLPRTNCQEIPSHSAASTTAGLIAVSTSPTEITLCDARSFAPVLRLDSPLTPFDCAIAFSPDGRSLALAGGTSRVMVWDIAWIKEELTRMGLGWSAGH